MIVESLKQDVEGFRQAVENGVPYPPLFVKIKLTFTCNLRCSICNHWREKREAPLDTQKFTDIIRELAEMGCRKLHFTGGEPLLHEGLTELMALASSLGIRVTMTTNGTLVDKRIAKELVKAGLRVVNISIDSPDRKTHDSIRGIDGAWKKTVRAVDFFQRYQKKGRPMIRINTVVSNQNYFTLGDMPDFAHRHGADQLNLIAIDGFAGADLNLNKQRIRDFNDNYAPQIERRAMELGLMTHPREAYPFGRTEHQIKLAKKGMYAFGWYQHNPCFVPWFHSLIDYNGLVYICCMTREQAPPIGDLKQSSFNEVWSGAGYEALRRKEQPLMPPYCSRCDNFLLENRGLLEMMRDEQPVREDN
jgi:MoaA/NifB/PqqE/SkfB family radical SAM enzyme